jgi:glutathione S-transferase
MTLADITVACHATYLGDAVPLDLARWPALAAHVQRCESLDLFQRFHAPFYLPKPQGTEEATA